MNTGTINNSITPPHIIIYSSGRSGSNRLLDILDQHDRTNCRNEPDSDDCDIGDLWKRTENYGLPDDFLEQWEKILKKCATHKGSRDRYDYLIHKKYLRPIVGALWVEAARREKLRRFLLGVTKNDWPIPSVVLKKDHFASIVPVLKVSGLPSWFEASHFNFRNQWIIHNIRRPHDYLNSWYNRFVRESGHTNEEMYGLVLESRSWMRREAGLPNFSKPYSFRDLLVVELWGWRFMNETLFTSLGESSRYMPVRYHEVSENKLAVAEKIFDFLGLEFGENEKDRLKKMKRTLFTNPHVEKLDEALVDEVVDEVIGDSPLRSFLF